MSNWQISSERRWSDFSDEEKAIMRAVHSSLYKRIYDSRDGVKRYINNGETVTFTDVEFTSYNAEFTLNHDNKFKLWYTQLAGVFFDCSLKDSTPHFGIIQWKDGKSVEMVELVVDQFWKEVQGKSFRVEVEIYARLNLRSNDLAPGWDGVEQVRKLIDNKEYDKLYEYDLLRETNMYSLNEL